MCGIVAVFGSTNAPQEVLQGLRHLEYRGYDSWGVGAIGEENIVIQKDIGKISEAILRDDFPKTPVAFGHTRWATHGGVTPENAHPHLSEDKRIAVVQNGIVENYIELRSELRGRGHVFFSDTDTEVFCHLIEEYVEQGDDLALAAKKAADHCEGRFAFAVLHAGEKRIVAVREGSPLILGIGEKSFYLASDTPAFLQHTNIVSYIDDGELVDITDRGALVFDLQTLKQKEKRQITLEQEFQDIEKGDHKHFMLKEILEQKETIRRAIDQNEEEIYMIAKAIQAARGTFLIGCGTAHKVAMAGEYFFSRIAKKHINTIVASEFPLLEGFLRPESLVIAISQSGETADVIEAIEAAKKAGSKVLSIVNSEGSTVARMSDFSLHIHAGPEKAVASTKAATSQMAVLLLLAYATTEKLSEGKALLIELASKINDLLNPRFIDFLQGVGERIASHENIFIIGKGAQYPMALEAAIKIQEVSYIHAEGFAAGELKHGPIAMIEEGTPCIVLTNDDPKRTKEVMSSAIEIKARGGYIIGIAAEKHEVFDEWIRVPGGGSGNALLQLIPIQLLAYALATTRGYDPDQPRNLAKSVTVK